MTQKQQPCKKHGIIDCPECYKECIEEILYLTYTRGDFAYTSDFGIVLFRKLVNLTGYDISKRSILCIDQGTV